MTVNLPDELRPRRGVVLVVVCAAALVINVDNTILNVALPVLVRDLHATSSGLQWIVDSYAMVFAGLLLVGGSLADRLGRRRFFLIGLTVFAAGSAGAAFSGSVGWLIAWRALMGAGAVLVVPSSKNPRAGRADPGGAALSVAGLGLLLWAVIRAPATGWTSSSVVAGGAASVVVLVAFVAWEARCRHPMLALGLFGDRRLSVAAAGATLGAFGLLGALFVQTQLLQFELGYSPLQAGLRILPLAGALAVSAAGSPMVVRAVTARVTAAVGLAAIAGGLWQVSAVSTATATYPDVLPGMLVIGLGAGLLLPTATSSIVGSVPPGDAGVGSAVNAVALQVGGALGVAVLGSVLATRYQDRLTAVLAGRPVPQAAADAVLGSLGGALAVADEAGGATGAALARAARAAFMSGSELALVVGAVVAVSGAAVVLVGLPSRTSTGAPVAPGTAPIGLDPI